jgi:hypothetical protein
VEHFPQSVWKSSLWPRLEAAVTTVKAKLEAIANVTMILVALATGYVALGKYIVSYRMPRWVMAGDRLAKIPNLDWKQHRHTLVLVLNAGCLFCERSAPFYQMLADVQAARRNDLGLVAVFPNEGEAVRQFMTRVGLHIASLTGVPLGTLRVSGTPTLMLVDKDGRVERAWIGTLTPSEQLDLLRVASVSQGCSTGELAVPQAGGTDNCEVGTTAQSKN